MLPFPPGAMVLAPMVAITNRAFRTLLHELGGPDWYCTEMASAEAFLSGGRHESIYLDPSPVPERTSVQFTARSPEALAQACERLAALPPENRAAGVDINMGCAAPHIRGEGRGSALLDDPERAIAMVRAARSSWPGLLSCKLRIGARLGEEGTIRLARSLADAGLDFITLHARFSTQKFRGSSDHAVCWRLAEAVDIPVIANGDITSLEDANRVLGLQPDHSLQNGVRIHGVMIGRAAARKPWIFARPPMTDIDLLAIALRYTELAEHLLPIEWQLSSCRRIFHYYAENLSFAHHVRTSINRARTMQELRLFLMQYFREVPQDRHIVKVASESAHKE